MKLIPLATVLALWIAPALAQERFPTDKSVELAEDGKRWFVHGRQTIASSVSVVSSRQTTITGDGDDCVIEVSGSLTLKTTKGGLVTLENVWIELTPSAKELFISECEFKGGGIRVSASGPTSAKVYLGYTRFDAKASCSLSFAAGSFGFEGGGSTQPMSIKGVPQSDKAGNKTKLSILACHGGALGFTNGLTVEGIADVLVRNSEFSGERTRFADWGKLEFDGNYAHSALTQFEQPVGGRFRGTDIHNADFGGEKLEFRCPLNEGKVEKLLIDHCWFRGKLEPESILKSMLSDHSSDATVGVEISFKRICESPLQLGGDVH